jgi:hypothetical protein
MFDPHLKLANGKIKVPKGPGVGIKDIKTVLSGVKEIA